MNMALAETKAEYDTGENEDYTLEDQVNDIITSRKMLGNASYFAFTATPKNKTLEVFGIRQENGSFRPYHSYTMKQAIQEGFIMDVLANYTPVPSFYRLAKKIEEDPEFDANKAQRKLRKYVESHDHAIRTKAEIMIDHFHDFVLKPRKIGGHRDVLFLKRFRFVMFFLVSDVLPGCFDSVVAAGERSESLLPLELIDF